MLPHSTSQYVPEPNPPLQPTPKAMPDDVSEPDLDPITAEEVNLYTIDIPKHLLHLKEIIPEVYWDYLDVFNGEKAATMLPDIRGPDINFAIELDPTKPLPKLSQPYHLNQEEHAECRKVLDEMLAAGWLKAADANCPLTAPMFFIWKKDGTQ